MCGRGIVVLRKGGQRLKPPARSITHDLSLHLEPPQDIHIRSAYMQTAALARGTAEQPLTSRRFTTLDLGMLGVLALQVVCHIVAAIARVGWISAAATVALTALALLGLAL